jgi:hypothetical protein
MWVLWENEAGKWMVGYWDNIENKYYSPRGYVFEKLSQAEAKVHLLNG